MRTLQTKSTFLLGHLTSDGLNTLSIKSYQIIITKFEADQVESGRER